MVVMSFTYLIHLFFKIIFTIPQPYLQRATTTTTTAATATDEVDAPWAGNDCFDCFAELGGCDTFFTGGGMYDDVPGECPKTRALYNNALQHCNQMVRYAGRTCPEGYDSYEFSFNYEDDFFGNDADDGFVPTDFFGTSVIIIVVASRFPYTRMCIPQPFSTLHPPLTYAMRIMCALALTCHGVLLCRVLSCDCIR